MTTALALPDHPFTCAMADALGISRKQLRTAVASRDVRRVLHGAYVRATLEDTIELRCAAASLRIRSDSVVCDRTAAWLHGIDILAFFEKEILPPLETCVPRFTEPTRRRDHDGHTRDLSEDDVMVLHGLRVTTPLRTALDLGCQLSARDALAVLDAFMRHHGITVFEMRREVGRYYRRRGVRQLRPLIGLADPRAESIAESWVRKDLIDAGLRPPAVQWWVKDRGVPTYRLDLAWPKHKVAVEYDGEEFHEETDEQREHDEERREWLRRQGWVIVVVKKHMLTAEAKALWIGEVRDAIASRTWRRCRTSRTESR